jgi:hypothetical protein
MVQRFLFNRIDAKPAAPAIRGHNHPIAQSLPDETESALAFVELTKSRAQPAFDAPIWQHRPPATHLIGLF